MKKIFAIVSVAVLLVACKDNFLDKTPLDKLSEESVFNSGALSESYVNALYSVLADPFQEGNIGTISDEGYFRYGGTSTRYIASGNMTADNVMYIEEGGQAHNTRTTILNIWNRAYEFIYRMNYFLAYADEKSTMDASDKKRLEGETYFLRAWTYYNLIQRYAGVPIITKAYSLDDTYDAARNNFDDCVDFILEDLDKAYDMVPAKADAVKGRVNKDIVLALRSRVTLVAASPLFNDPSNPEGGIFRGTYSADKWTRAYNAAKAIVNRADVDNAYQLDDTYDGYWKDVNSPEIIWGKFFTTTQGNKAQLFYSIVYFNGWTALNPSQAIAIDYEMTNGKKIYEEGSGFDPDHPFNNRDPRFGYSIAYEGSTYHTYEYGDKVLDLALHYDGIKRDAFAKGKTDPSYSSKGTHLWHATNTLGLELNKWYIPEKPITESETGSVVYPWFRLGEMYLNLAEAAYMTGKENECRDYINKIRDRADVQMPHVTTSGESLWDDLVEERRIEMAFETVRYFDTRRWKTAPFYENVPFAGMQTRVLSASNDTIYRIARPYDESRNNTCYYWEGSDTQASYIKANGSDIFEAAAAQSDGTLVTKGSCIQYTWHGQKYWVDYGDCCLTVSPTQKHFPKVGDVYPNYLMPIPANEMTKSNGTLVQNPGY